MVATERNYCNGTTERRIGNGKTATAARQGNGGNQALLKLHRQQQQLMFIQ